jgi:hypothetical protein
MTSGISVKFGSFALPDGVKSGYQVLDRVHFGGVSVEHVIFALQIAPKAPLGPSLEKNRNCHPDRGGALRFWTLGG